MQKNFAKKKRRKNMKYAVEILEIMDKIENKSEKELEVYTYLREQVDKETARKNAVKILQNDLDLQVLEALKKHDKPVASKDLVTALHDYTSGQITASLRRLRAGEKVTAIKPEKGSMLYRLNVNS
jgi:pyruvate kinase